MSGVHKRMDDLLQAIGFYSEVYSIPGMDGFFTYQFHNKEVRGRGIC
jgi:hypothetical protein